MVAGEDDASLEARLNGVRRVNGGETDVFHLASAVLLEHPVHDGHTSRGHADAHADAGEVLGAELIDDGLEAVVAGVATAELHADHPGVEVELVMDVEDLVGGDVILGAELGDGAAARVHVALRLCEHHLTRALLAANAHDGDLGSALALPVAGS